MMTDKDAAELLGPEWDLETGYFGQLRAGRFSPDEHRRIMEILRDVERGEVWDATFVSLVWFVPTFMAWQTERIRETGADPTEYNKAISEATDVLLELFGPP